MASRKVRYPGPGCVVEFMQGNSPTLALVLEEQGGRLRLHTQHQREVSLPAGRLLPWSGPDLGRGLSRQDRDRALEEVRRRREDLAGRADLAALWEIVQGEVDRASAEWMASLLWEEADVDHEAALGRRLLAGKTHFRFNPPDFDIFSAGVVEKRLAETEAARLREALASAGAAFFRILWDVHAKRRPAPSPAEIPEPDLAGRLRHILLQRIAEAEEGGDNLWKALVKGLPEHPCLALILAVAWGLVPEHYNFWLDRAGFARGEDWANGEEVARFEETSAVCIENLPEWPDAASAEHLVSIDPAESLDRDDAFSVSSLPDGSFRAVAALACPALAWPFATPLDRAVQGRASSLYLPEGDEHMLPEAVGWRMFGLDTGHLRPALILDMRFGGDGQALDFSVCLKRIRIADNLSLDEAQEALASAGDGEAPSVRRVLPHSPSLTAGLELARRLQARRIEQGAVITRRPDPAIRLREENGEVLVALDAQEEPHLAHMLVGEIMIAANAGLAAWARDKNIPLLYRTQDVALPREFAGIWDAPQDIARIIRALPPAVLEAQPRRHAGLGLGAYATFSSPMRRYADLFNQGQIVSFLRRGEARACTEELVSLLPFLSARQEAVTQVQRLRPRYWKLLFFRQQGDKIWWDAVVTEENGTFVSVVLPWAQIFIRGRRGLFGDKTYPGQAVQVRLGKVNPLLNEIQIMETRE
ncbi:MAG: RNB domain-containing ribonuclease [Desulfovibrio sp.]|jgi:exoribonuclease-2|nr:RNB domain-containing ribonuclease [Desulfovibrio sp.]